MIGKKVSVKATFDLGPLNREQGKALESTLVEVQL
jgi:hypothetical protein